MQRVVVALNLDSQVDPTLDVFDANSTEEALGMALAKHKGKGVVMGWAVKRPDLSEQETMQQQLLNAIAPFRPNQKIAAIKEVRAITGLGLKEAKQWLDEHWEVGNDS